MANHSTNVPQCNHRLLEVAVMALAASVVALISGIVLSQMKVATPDVLCLRAATLAGTFAALLAIAKYVRQI